MRARSPHRIHGLLLLFALAAVASCGGPEVVEAERAWAERATLEVARVNDLVALKIVTNLAGEATSDGGTAPRWQPMHAACSELRTLPPGIREVAAEAPPGYERAGQSLEEFADHIAAFASQCETATAIEDIEAWYSLEDEMAKAGDSAVDVAKRLPSDITCPEDVSERPETCDV